MTARRRAVPAMAQRRSVPPFVAIVAAVLGVAVLAWLAGFAWFAAEAVRAEASLARADGIVVLTGGADRIAAGVRLLREGRGRVLLISGVGHGADLSDLLRGTGIDPAPIAPAVTLGHTATTTAGNADETADWVQAQGLHSLLVVTASYHMRRALTELQRSLPRVTLIPMPVRPPALRHAGLATVRLLAGEYTKWLAAELWLGRLGAEGRLGAAGQPGTQGGRA